MRISMRIVLAVILCMVVCLAAVSYTHLDVYKRQAKRYVNEWLQVRVDQDLSGWTIQAEAKALGKLYGIKPDDEEHAAR